MLLRTQQRLLRSQQVLTDTLEHMSQGIFMVDAERKIAVINRRTTELLGLPPDLATAGLTNFDDLLRWQLDRGEFDNAPEIRQLAEAGGIELTDSVYERTRPNGTVLEVRTRVLPNNRAVRTFTDVTERKRAEAQISYLAHHDGLTGLANRALFHAHIAQAINVSGRTGAGFAVLCLDLDRFKQVNDTWGHGTGDRLLQSVVKRLRCSLRATDLAARFGGDEFAILQAAGQPKETVALAQSLVRGLAQPFQIDGRQLLIGVSVGVALYPADGLTADQLLKSADIALYRAKEEGRGTFRFFEPEMDLRLQERYALERDLREAITEGRLDVYFQPICAADSGSPLAYEALARWTHPDRGSISPQVFISLAEEAGLISALGRSVLRAACVQAVRWPSRIRLAVNLSPLQFLEPGLDGQILGILRETGLDPHRLDLEVTEGVLIRNGEGALAAMRALQRQGVRVCRDDFGTGHAGLTYLLRFPFDGIKIDRSFVGSLATDRAAQTIVRAAMILSENLGLDVVAEGVEAGAQLDTLCALGCRQVQGYLFGKPVPGHEVAERWTGAECREAPAVLE